VADDLYETHGIITRNYGPTLVLSPPLVFERTEAERTTSAIVEVLRRLDVESGRIEPR
jgi:putrescine aminotransferase